MSEQPTSLIFGIQEESWPKGHGYLYVKTGKASRREWLCDLNLYDTDYDAVRALFRKALEKVIGQLGYSAAKFSALAIEVENMSSLARTTLLLEISNLCLSDALETRKRV